MRQRLLNLYIRTHCYYLSGLCLDIGHVIVSCQEIDELVNVFTLYDLSQVISIQLIMKALNIFGNTSEDFCQSDVESECHSYVTIQASQELVLYLDQ